MILIAIGAYCIAILIALILVAYIVSAAVAFAERNADAWCSENHSRPPVEQARQQRANGDCWPSVVFDFSDTPHSRSNEA